MAAGDNNGRRPRVKLENEIKTRPLTLAVKQGKLGIPIALKANYYNLTKKTDWSLYKYRVDISPEEERTFVRKSLVFQHKAVLGFFLCDGTTLYSSVRYPKNPLELKSIRNEDKLPMMITLRLVGDVATGDAHIIQFFNIIVRKCLENMKLELIGRNYWDPAARMNVPSFNFEVWPGYKTSIRQQERSIMMCTDISHKIMRTDTALDNLKAMYEKNRHNYQTDFLKLIIGSIVLTKYNNKTYKVDDVDWKINPSCTFTKDGKEITYIEYYKTKYQLTIKDKKQPLLISRLKERDRRAGLTMEFFCLIPELCILTGISDDMRSDFVLMKALSDITRVNPEVRVKKLQLFKDRLLSAPQSKENFNQWNLAFDKDLVEFNGRVLPAEKLYYGKKVESLIKNADWNFDMQDKPAFSACKIERWYAVVPRKFKNDAKTFIQKMIQAARCMSVTISMPLLHEVSDIPSGHEYVDALEQITSKCVPQLIFIVVPNNQLLRYQAIKKKLCIDRPIPSQIVMSKTLKQKTDSRYKAVGGKVAAQMNCKLGGIPWSIQLGTLLPKLMVVGFDVCHSGGKSFGAMVASLDTNIGRYYSAVANHTPGEELSSGLAAQLVRACQEFRKLNNDLPDRIAVYRDGVGEGQLGFVYEFEVAEIKRQLERLYQPRNYKLLFTVVTKRLNTRIFTKNDKNPPPGTIVDDVITNPLQYDYFIIPQSVNQGTVAPTAFNVIEDHNFSLTPDRVQVMTYKLCHLYFNFSGTVRVPAPCQYAHKLAFFTATNLLAPAHSSLQTTLYFL